MIVHSQLVPHPRIGVETGEAHGSLTVNAKVLTCLLPDFDQVSITVVDDIGEISTLARTGDLVTDLDQLQYGLGEGPCIDSLRDAQAVLAPHIERDDRWRRYSPAAAALGLRSQVATPLRCPDGKALGSLNLYSTTHAQIGFSAPVVAGVMAAQVVAVLLDSRKIEDLHRALDVRAVIGQATGLVMAWLGSDADDAYTYLQRLAAQQDRTLALVAEELVHTRQLPSLGTA